jgi:hypothetical protein
MKRLLAIILATVFVSVCGISALADETNNGGNTTITVNGNFVAGASAGTTVSVNVAWDAMSFTYTEGDAGEWLPNDHEYAEDASGYWSDTGKNITVTNHSNTAITATLSFTAANGTNITGAFTESSGTANDNILALPTAEGTNYANAPQTTATFKITGGTITQNSTLGTITVFIAASAAASNTISDQAELQTALNAGGSIMLGNDIAGTYTVEESEAVIDLSGKSLSSNGQSQIFLCESGSNVTVIGTSASTLSYSAYAIYCKNGARVAIEGDPTFVSASGLADFCWEGNGVIDLSRATGSSYTVMPMSDGMSIANLILPAGYNAYDSENNVISVITPYEVITVKR